MTRENKIANIKRVATAEGVSFIEGGIKTSKGEGDMILADGLYEDICGDWARVSSFEEMTDEDIDIMYSAMIRHCEEIMAMA